MSGHSANDGERFVPAGYGDAAAELLAGARPLVLRTVDAFAARLRNEIAEEAGPSSVLAGLAPLERADLLRQHGAHLVGLLEPVLDEATVVSSGVRLGRVHAAVGVEMGWYARAAAAFQKLLAAGIASELGVSTRAGIDAVLFERLVDDARGVLLGHREVDAAQSAALTLVSEIAANAATVVDLARRVLEVCASLDGMAAGFFGRPNADGRFEFEIAAGTGIEAFLASIPAGDVPPITTSGKEDTGLGPAGRAWRAGRIERSDSYLSDPSTAPWRTLGERFGFRSSAAVPLVGSDGRPRALLSMYASFPGFFAVPGRLAWLGQLKQLVERALERIEAGTGHLAAVSGFATRALHLDRLRSGEVEFRFQPVVSFATGGLDKLEALARLRHDGRLVSPSAFLSAFGDEELLMLVAIGLEESLRALGEWEAAGLVTGVSLNLPATSAEDSRCVELVADALARHRIAPARLTLELLETTRHQGEPSARPTAIDALKALGVRLAEDDLGSGYSSLRRFRSIAFDEVKIDQELVRGAERAPREALTFIHPLTHLAHSLGRTVVVEGLETVGLVEAALLLGADGGQGFAIAPPLPATEVPAWARTFRLEVDPGHPRTTLGGLAAHLAWEIRLHALGGDASLVELAARDGCPLSDFIAATAGDRVLEGAHSVLHATALARRLGAEHRGAWDALAALLRERVDAGRALV